MSAQGTDHHIGNPHGDYVLPFLLDVPGVRGRVLRLDRAAADILAPHGYPPLVARLVAETLALAALLSSLLKAGGRFVLQIQSDGPVSLLIADVVPGGGIRACAQFDAGSLPDWAEGRKCPGLEEICGAGRMVFSIDQGPNTELYQGIVALEGESLTACLRAYFQHSEQIRTGIRLAVKADGQGGAVAGAVLVQEIPGNTGEDEESEEKAPDGEDWNRTMVLLSSCTDSELTDPDLSAHDLLLRLFHQEDVIVYEAQMLEKSCRCTRDSLRALIAGMPPESREEMSEEGRITIRCEFCARDFAFAPDTLEPVPPGEAAL